LDGGELLLLLLLLWLAEEDEAADRQVRVLASRLVVVGVFASTGVPSVVGEVLLSVCPLEELEDTDLRTIRLQRSEKPMARDL